MNNIDKNKLVSSLASIYTDFKNLYNQQATNEDKEKLVKEITTQLNLLKNKISRVGSGDLIIRFGKFKGHPVREIPAWYLIWCYEQDWFKEHNKELYSYIKSNLKNLKKEAQDGSLES